jgi:hypothetical protein
MQKQIIHKDQVSKKLYDIYPEFKVILETEYDLEEISMSYPVAGRFSTYLLELYKQGHTENFKIVAELIEDLLTYGDSYVSELAVIGYLEGIQNIWDNNAVDSEIFYGYLLPKSRQAWDELKVFWQRVIEDKVNS